MAKARRIIMGDRVRWNPKKMPHQENRLGTVGYSPYSLEICCVVWDRRKTHDVIPKRLLIRVNKRKAGVAR